MGLSQLFNLHCPACEQPEPAGRLCAVCVTYLQTLDPSCECCAEPLTTGAICGACLQKPPPWDAIDIPWRFDGLTRHLIHQYKYRLDRAAGHALLSLWSPAVREHRPDALIAVPMHHRKQAREGFNHAEDITRQLSRQTGIRRYPAVRRQRPTRALEGLSRTERRQELAGSFQLTQPPPQRVAIIDDVLTTGATTAELTRTLKRSGCQFVAVWALARTPLGDV